jgi:hypothetical protein
MKQILVKKLILPLLMILFSSNAFSTSQFAFTCPDKFIATVTNVEDVYNSGFPKIEVSFQIIQKIKGGDFESKKIQVVKDGPVDFQTGSTYTVEMRDGWLCNAAVLSNI